MNRVTFPQKLLPYILVAPQIIITLVFFFWPASQAIYDSFIRTNAFGQNPRFIGLENFVQVLNDPTYFETVWTTVIFSGSVAVVALLSGLIFAVMAQRVIAGRGFYRTMMIWPYAVAPAVAGMLWLFMFSPQMGTFAYLLRSWGVDWNPLLNGTQAMILVVVASAWKQISYNFLFFVAGLQAIPLSLIEAASIDGASRRKRFWTITFPLLAPTSFFLLVINTVYAFFDTFGIIHAVTSGGPGKSTETLVYKVFVDAFQNPSPGISAAESVILMTIVILLTSIQFRYVERKVHYA